MPLLLPGLCGARRRSGDSNLPELNQYVEISRMQVFRNTGLLLFALVFTLASVTTVYGAEPDKDKDPRPKQSNSSAAGKTSSSFVRAGECLDPGSASAELDVNNVRARLFNNGNLFYQGGDL